MALARYFEKAALSVASLLQGVDYSWVRARLEAQVVSVRYDQSAASTAEGRMTLELLVSLLARLYPTLSVEPLGAAEPGLAGELWQRTTAINRLLDRSPATGATLSIVVGATPLRCEAPVLYAGSDGWVLKTSSTQPQGCGTTSLPYGAGGAACIAAAWAFRQVFGDLLPDSPAPASPDPNGLTLSLLDFTGGVEQTGEFPETIHIGETHLIGVGAIGNAAAWALARTPGLEGTLRLVDGERLDLTNVQRYVLTRETDEDAKKVDLGRREFPTQDESSPRLEIAPIPYHWADYLGRRSDYRIDRVLLALDSAEARIAAQASLPRWIANSWTQPENLGVSRHEFLEDGPCVACLYLPKGERPNRDELVAAAIQAEGQVEMLEIRRLLRTGAPMGAEFVTRVAERLNVDVAKLLPYAASSLDNFYVRAVCGGVLLRLGAQTGAPAEVPMAFQSAMAGILLAAELVADAGQLREVKLPARTEFDLRRPAWLLGLRPHVAQQKDPSGRCICRDDTYRSAYAAKYMSGGGLLPGNAHEDAQ